MPSKANAEIAVIVRDFVTAVLAITLGPAFVEVCARRENAFALILLLQHCPPCRQRATRPKADMPGNSSLGEAAVATH